MSIAIRTISCDAASSFRLAAASRGVSGGKRRSGSWTCGTGASSDEAGRVGANFSVDGGTGGGAARGGVGRGVGAARKGRQLRSASPWPPAAIAGASSAGEACQAELPSQVEARRTPPLAPPPVAPLAQAPGE